MRALPDVNQIQVSKLERGGVDIPIGTNTKLQRLDIVTVVGLKEAVTKVGVVSSARWCVPAPRRTC